MPAKTTSRPHDQRHSPTANGLIEKIAAGDRRAEQDLYNLLVRRVIALVYRMTGNREATWDLTQETFLAVYRAAPTWQGRGSAEAWVLRIAGNLARQAYRSDDRRRRLVEGYARSTHPDRTAGGSLQAVDRLVVREALAQLPAALRQVVVLALVDGLSHEEIASGLDIAVGTSRARLSRGRDALRRMLSQTSDPLPTGDDNE